LCPHYKREPLPEQPAPAEPDRLPSSRAAIGLDVAGILERIAALSIPGGDDNVEWLTALARDVTDCGIVGDNDPSATAEACCAVFDMADEVRALAEAARVALNMMRIKRDIEASTYGGLPIPHDEVAARMLERDANAPFIGSAP
jgi:hypothetical protein